MPKSKVLKTNHPYYKENGNSAAGFHSKFTERKVEKWINNLNDSPSVVLGTESSLSDGTYHVPCHYSRSIQSPPSPDYQMPYVSGTWKSRKIDSALLNKGCIRQQRRNPTFSSSSISLPDEESRLPEHSTFAVIHSVTPEVPTIGACGGHCPGFEYVCYYILQVIFVVGILTGISLCIAGIVLKRINRNGNLGVLVYIGCLASMVCGLLLSVQSCARRGTKRRKMPTKTQIPLQTIQETSPTACPLLLSSLPQTHLYRNMRCSEEEITGVPWWRRSPLD